MSSTRYMTHQAFQQDLDFGSKGHLKVGTANVVQMLVDDHCHWQLFASLQWVLGSNYKLQ